MSVKINALELENVKRIKAVKIDPTQNGLTIIGGDNNQGKTSVLDSIAWALGGDKNKPSNAAREGSTIPPVLKVTLSNGIIVERKGKNSSLKVTDPSGKKAGQNLLNSFIEQLALDLPKFMTAFRWTISEARSQIMIFPTSSPASAIWRQKKTARARKNPSSYPRRRLWTTVMTCPSTSTRKPSISMWSIRLRGRLWRSCGGWRRKLARK